MGSNRTAVLTRLASGVALGLCATWLAGAAPALAKDKASDHEINEARDACKQVAENRDWKNISTNVQDSSDERVRVMVKGKRRGEDRERECRYNLKSHEADLAD